MLASWNWDKWVVFAVPIVLVLVAALVMFLMRKTIRSRFRVTKQLRDDPDINVWLVIFDWSRKVLYVPMIIVSLAAGVLAMFPGTIPPQLVGGVWLTVFFVNFLVDEYELSIKLILILVLLAVVLGLWLIFLGWLRDFFTAFTYIKVAISPAAYFTIAGIFGLAILISWLKGLFYYVAITPNYLNLQVGPTETGEQVSREEYSTRVDTGDFLERVLGFGRIIITFADHRRAPLSLLVWRIGKKAQTLESIRGILVFDRYPSNHPSSMSSAAGKIEKSAPIETDTIDEATHD